MARARCVWRGVKVGGVGGDERGDSVAETISPRGKSDTPQRESFPQRGVAYTEEMRLGRTEHLDRRGGRSCLSGCRSRSRLLTLIRLRVAQRRPISGHRALAYKCSAYASLARG